MTELSLINKNRLQNNDPISKSLLTKLRLNVLFCDNTLDILSHLCGREDILARQEIIRALETDTRAKEQFSLLYKRLTELSRVLDRYNDSVSDCERLFVFKECVSRYFTVLDSALPAGGFFCERLSARFADLKTKSKTIYDAFDEYIRLIDEISRFQIVFSENGYYLTVNTDTDKNSALDSIIKDADALGWGGSSTEDDKTIPFISALSGYLNALYPDAFKKLAQLEKLIYDSMEIKLLSLIREMDFYFDILELIKRAESHNIPHTYPAFADKPSFSADELYDVTLLSAKAGKIVPNDVRVSPEKRCYFICGANGGGKTTYLRSVGSQLIMFLGGCPVFCRNAEIYAYTTVFGHFPQDEDSSDYGRLDREISAVSEIIEKCDDKSFVFLNETFSGGTQSRAAALALSTMDQLSEKGGSCLFVTHFRDVYNSKYPVLSPVVSDDAAHTRTYRIGFSDKPGDSYAGDILKKYDLDEKSLGNKP